MGGRCENEQTSSAVKHNSNSNLSHQYFDDDADSMESDGEIKTPSRNKIATRPSRKRKIKVPLGVYMNSDDDDDIQDSNFNPSGSNDEEETPIKNSKPMTNLEIDQEKQPQSSFSLFSNVHRATIKEKNLTMNDNDVVKELSMMWEIANTQEKAMFEEEAALAKVTWEKRRCDYRSDDEAELDVMAETGEKKTKVVDKPRHKIEDYNEKLHACEECNKYFSNKVQLQNHHSVVHVIKIHYCEFCSKEFKNKILCKQHVKNVHEAIFKVEEQCDQCSKVFKTKGLLYSHTIAVHAESDHMYCHICGGKYKNQYALKRHVRKCEIKPKKSPINFVPGNKVGEPGFEETFFDEECDRTYLTYKAFRVHKHNSHSSGPLLCKICETVLKSREILKTHLKMKHGIEDKELLKGLTGTGYAKRGKTLESSEMERCVTCNKDYSRSYYVGTHRDRCAAGKITRGKPVKPPKGSSENVQCLTCGQEYSHGYYHRTHRDRCAAGLISTRPPMNPEAIASLTPEVLAMYAVSKASQPNEEQLRKHEEKVKRWRELEEEQRKDAKLNPAKYPKEKQGKNTLTPVKSESKKKNVCR